MFTAARLPYIGAPSLERRQLALHDFARRVARKFLNEHRAAGYGEPRDPLFGVGDDFGLGDGLALPHDDVRGEALSPIAVGDPGDHYIGNARVVDQRILEFAREDVLAAGNDHVVVASGHEQATQFVEISQVPGAHEPSGECPVSYTHLTLPT